MNHNSEKNVVTGKRRSKTLKRLYCSESPIYFVFFYEHYFSGSLSFCSCGFNATAFHLTLLLRPFFFFNLFLSVNVIGPAALSSFPVV